MPSSITIPTWLTLGRCVAVPLLAVVYFVPASWATAACTGIYIAACFTDWLDGYLARKLDQCTELGLFLDPVADKLLVATALVLLLAKEPQLFLQNDVPKWVLAVPAAVIVNREIFVSALREWAATTGTTAKNAVKVSWTGKCKTASQMVSLGMLLALRDANSPVELKVIWVAVGLLYVSAYLTLLSMIEYIRAFAGLNS